MYSGADLKSADRLFFSLDSCVMSHVELFTVSFGLFKSLLNVLFELKAVL